MKINIVQLEADSLYDLVFIWLKMELIITEEDAFITGKGLPPDIAWALNTLMPEWDLTICLARIPEGLQKGNYSLVKEEGVLYACRGLIKCALPEQTVLVNAIPSS